MKVKSKCNVLLFLVILASTILRCYLVSIDYYLYDWDERFHALVAKNMMQQPLKPMLYVNHLFTYEVSDWSSNHVWVHKQPLFLWQMALSMHLFGVNTFALRLPSILMSGGVAWFIYGAASKMQSNRIISLMAAAFYSFSFVSIELVTGRYLLDTNDMAFVFYVTASIWAFVNYSKTKQWKWAIIIGVFVGSAILNKWLTGLLVYSGWGMSLLVIREERANLNNWLQLAVSSLMACIVFVPWQLHIMKNFPKESAATYSHNRKHIFEALDGHGGDWTFHFNNFVNDHYCWIALPFLLIGIWLAFKIKPNRQVNIAYITMLVCIYSFFTLVKTKMPSFVLPTVLIIWFYVTIGLFGTFGWLKAKFTKQIWVLNMAFYALVLFMFVTTLRPNRIVKYRSSVNEWRQNKLHNTKAFLKLSDELIENHIIFNCPGFQHTDIMFFKDAHAYLWYPSQDQIKKVRSLGLEVAVFKERADRKLPQYLYDDEDIYWINSDLTFP